MAWIRTFLVAFVCLCASVHSDVISLNGNDWNINDNGTYSAQGQVPGTIHTILIANNKIPDPYLGFNDVNLRYLIYHPWTFKKTFNLNADFLANTKFTLRFDQVDTVANITLNNCNLGQTNSMFLAYEFNVAKSCLQSQNELRLDFESPVLYALRQSIAYNQTVKPECTAGAQNGECHVQFIRKEPCSFSWDWGPAFGPIGIPGNVSLQGLHDADVVVKLESLNVASYQTSTQQWQVDLILSSNIPSTVPLKFVLQDTSFSYELNMTVGQNTSVSLFIPNNTVELWWPNGYGNQTLYKLCVYSQGQLVGSRLTGFRTVQLVQNTYGGNIKGNSFYFAVNGVPIFVKGSNWIPPDSFQERVTDEWLERLLRSAKLANMNMLRIWGGGIYERDSFYEIADRLGIMFWHDFMFACSYYPVDEPFLDNIRNEVIYQVKRLQSHPSIVLWSGNNENEAAVAQNWWGVKPDQMPKIKDDYRTLYVHVIMSALQEVDRGTNRPFVTSSPSNGIETIAENYIANNPQDPIYGDVHFYGYSDDSWDRNTYPITRFLSETGIQSLPSLDTWLQATTNISDLQILSPFLVHREHSGGQLNAIMKHVQCNLPVPVTTNATQAFIQWIYLTQINQAVTYKSISDVCRVHSSVNMIDPQTSQGNTMGLMYWQINDIWQAPTWATIEYGLKWKMAHYYVKHMYEPIYPLPLLEPYLANVTDENARISIYVINEISNSNNGHLTCSFLALNSFATKASVQYDISLSSTGVQHVADLPYTTVMKSAGCADGTQCVFQCVFNSSQEDFGQTLFLSQPKNYQLSEPNVRIQSVKQVSPTEISVTVAADAPALFVWLDVPITVGGHFSSNGFHMFQSTVTVNYHLWEPASDMNVADLNVQVTSLYDVTKP